MSAQLENIKKNYGYDPADVKWIGRGGSIFEYLGMEVMRLDFTRVSKADPEVEGSEDKWENKVGKALLLKCKNYDPMTETVDLMWKDVDYGREEKDWDIHTTKITSIGFSYGDPAERGEMVSFMPYSRHTKKIETEALYAKLKFLMMDKENKAITLSNLLDLASSRDKERLLGHVIDIATVIKPVDEDDVYIYRLGTLGMKHQFGSVWKLTAKDVDGRGEITLNIDTAPGEDGIDTNTQLWEMRNGSSGKVEAYVRFFDLRTAFSLPTPEE